MNRTSTTLHQQMISYLTFWNTLENKGKLQRGQYSWKLNMKGITAHIPGKKAEGKENAIDVLNERISIQTILIARGNKTSRHSSYNIMYTIHEHD